MPTFQGVPPWPASTTSDKWVAWAVVNTSTPGQLLGPPAPVPSHAGGPGNTLLPDWNLDEQTAEWQTS
jgi:hypothetical protein